MKRLILVLVLLLSLSLTGCIQKYTNTEEKDNAVAEYMAGLLLKSDTNYNQELIPMEEENTDSTSGTTVPQGNNAIPTVAPDTSGTNTTSNPDSTVSQAEYTISEVIGTNDLDIKYKSYLLAETYPEDSESAYFSLTPRLGYQLLVVNFSVKNNTKKDHKLNLIDTLINYQLEINVGTIYEPQFTLLENDLRYINVTVKAGDAIDAFLVFEVSKDLDITNINLLVSKDNKSKIVEIK